MIIGAITGVTVYALNAYGVDTPLKDIPFMMMAFYLFMFCVVVQITVSLVTGQAVPEDSAKLCWGSPLEPLRAKGWPGIGNYKFLSALLMIIMIILYTLFQ